MNVTIKKKGRKPVAMKVINDIFDLKVGQSLILKKEDWKLKTLPGAHILRRKTGNEYKVNTLLDESGWTIKRIS